ncbi:tetratricopeptide repeat protein, partial [Acinetobacter baumannii]|uniref:tetratricopeptide repeat protein n=1 Tax=Acinetobacter baumannii TaxID=470 RepID=UPI00214CCF0F
FKHELHIFIKFMIKIKRLFLVFLIYLLPYPIYAQEIKILNMNNDLIEEIKSIALQGNADAQVKLGLLYIQGLGVPQDYILARQWFEKAAK